MYRQSVYLADGKYKYSPNWGLGHFCFLCNLICWYYELSGFNVPTPLLRLPGGAHGADKHGQYAIHIAKRE